MVALQNLQYILIKASDNSEFTKTTYVIKEINISEIK